MTGARVMRWLVGALIVAAIAVALVSARSGTTTDEAVAGGGEPSRVVPIAGTDVSRVTLSARAAARLGIRTAPVTRHGARKVIPYSAVLYDPEGRTFTYTSPRPLVFVRRPIGVQRIAAPQSSSTSYSLP